MANNGWYRLEAEKQGKAEKRTPPPSPPAKRPPPKPTQTQNMRVPMNRPGPKPAPPPMDRPKGPPRQGMPAPPPRRPQADRSASEVSHNPLTYSGTKHSVTVGSDGPVPLQDINLHETLETFVNQKIIERAVHVKGFGAFGYFQVAQSMGEYTTAPFLQTAGQQIPVVTRFSLAVSTKGTPDTGRNVRGFSTKFYTEQGVFDLLCNHIPVFLVRDAIRFPESINAFLPSPVNNLADPERFWGFVATAPEATHFLTWLYSDVGTIKSLRKIRASSVNTYVWKNAQGVRRYVKYHWVPLAGEEYITAQEAGSLAGSSPDICGQDLYDTIAKGTPVEYDLKVQLMDPQDAEFLPYDPLDCTKTWDEEQYPLTPVGRLVLNRNTENYMEQIEKVAFSPANLAEGIELSNDKMLQGRSTIYWDAQRRRLGPNFRQIPVNKEAGFSPDQLITSSLGEHTEGRQMRSEILKADDFTQAGERYHSLSPEQQEHLVDNMAGDLVLVSRETQSIVLSYLSQASQEMGERVLGKMGQYRKG